MIVSGSNSSQSQNANVVSVGREPSDHSLFEHWMPSSNAAHRLAGRRSMTSDRSSDGRPDFDRRSSLLQDSTLYRDVPSSCWTTTQRLLQPAVNTFFSAQRDDHCSSRTRNVAENLKPAYDDDEGRLLFSERFGPFDGVAGEMRPCKTLHVATVHHEMVKTVDDGLVAVTSSVDRTMYDIDRSPTSFHHRQTFSCIVGHTPGLQSVDMNFAESNGEFYHHQNRRRMKRPQSFDVDQTPAQQWNSYHDYVHRTRNTRPSRNVSPIFDRFPYADDLASSQNYEQTSHDMPFHLFHSKEAEDFFPANAHTSAFGSFGNLQFAGEAEDNDDNTVDDDDDDDVSRRPSDISGFIDSRLFATTEEE